VAVLFARADSHYKAMQGVDVWVEARDARRWPGGVPLVAHQPCRLWAKLRQFAKASNPEMERQLAIDAVARVRRFGGVLEHPAESTLWAHIGLPLPGRAPDDFGGWTAQIRQCDWGHKAEKLTWLYIVGCHPDDLPPLPPRGEPTGVIKPRNGRDSRPGGGGIPDRCARRCEQLAAASGRGCVFHEAFDSGTKARGVFLITHAKNDALRCRHPIL
jgi:hypothetical protein